MKKWLCLALCMLLCTAACFAEPAEEKTFDGATALERDEVYKLDLDGDGAEESVQIHMQGYEGEENLQLVVQTDELVYTYDTFIMTDESACAADLDGDGTLELLLSGDEASADYSTWCLEFDRDEGLKCIEFADAGRDENTGEYGEYGYGRLDAIDGNVLTLTGSQDALGTWWCSRQFTLRDGRFELDDDGVWHVVDETLDTDDPEFWDYGALTLVRDLNVTLEDGSEATLKPGNQFVVTETDKVSYVGFVTKDGVRGRISVEPNVEDGWGFLIDGASEYDYFEYIPYAD